MCITIKKDEKELLFEFKKKKCDIKSKILENGKADAFKQICQ